MVLLAYRQTEISQLTSLGRFAKPFIDHFAPSARAGQDLSTQSSSDAAAYRGFEQGGGFGLGGQYLFADFFKMEATDG